MRVWIFALALLSAVAVADKINDLPGCPPLNFDQYSGYIVVNQTHQRNMFYWFVESQNSPSTDPLVLWLNGGPGCSSLGGFFSENGPMFVNPDGATLRLNPYSWNTMANVLYLESPSGVGFSTSLTPSDYKTGDAQTAADSVAFLQKFLLQFPQYQGRDFWISGESYAGHYVPNLAKAILEANAAGAKPFINLVGFQVGNAWTDAPLDNRGAVEFWYSHALISKQTFEGLMLSCDFAAIGPLKAPKTNAAGVDLCDVFRFEAHQAMANLNIYQIYYDVCLETHEREGVHLMKQVAEANPQSPFYFGQVKPSVGLGDQYPDPDPCVSAHLNSYLNLDSVKKAIHAEERVHWLGCSVKVQYSYEDLLSSVIPVYQWLLTNSKIRMLIYSGDTDAIVPVTGTRNWLGSMNLTITEKWRPWTDRELQTGGWVEKYKWGSNPDGLTFATVRNAGHMVPWDQPWRSLDLFGRFLKNEEI